MSASLPHPTHLFVYGTLQADLQHPMHRVLYDHAEQVGRGMCNGRLYDLGYYPGLIRTQDVNERVAGEVYCLRDVPGVLAALDVYEGCGLQDPPPREYRREIVDVLLADGRSIAAWTYLYCGSLDGATIITDGEYTVHQAVTIRAEQPGDYAAIDAVNQAAFGQDVEGRLIRNLRAGDAFDPDLSLVAERGGQVVGHLLLSALRIVGAAGETPALALAPMAVVPPLQRQGIGSTLVRAALAAGCERGHRLVIVVGHPTYYPRFGFQPARAAGLEVPFPVPDEAFMVAELSLGALSGVCGKVEYPDAFNEVKPD